VHVIDISGISNAEATEGAIVSLVGVSGPFRSGGMVASNRKEFAIRKATPAGGENETML